MTETYESLIMKASPYLVEYLELMGVEFNRLSKFSCINPEHEDREPSSSIIPDSNGEAFHCFGCLASGDVFTAAHYLEGKPLLGPGFLSENVEYILNKFGVEHEKIELSKEQIRKIRFSKLHNAVMAAMHEKDEEGNLVHLELSHAIERGWKEETCQRLSIGTIKDFKKFTDSIQKKTSLSKIDMEEMGLSRDLFGPKKLTFTIRDHTGMVAGFVARAINWKKGSSVPKYKNTSEFKNPFYDKSKILYGLDGARKLTGLRLDIFEGYGDYVTAYQEGYKNCAAMGGTAFTQSHVDLLYDLGFRHINLIYDNDKTGEALREATIERFSGYQGLKVTIMHLPIPEGDLEVEGQNDPDFYIRKYGIKAYREIRTIGAFEHKISKQKFAPMSEEAVSFAKETCRLILNEENRIERGRMIKALSKHTGIDKSDLEAEIDRIEGSELVKIKDDLQRKLRWIRDPDTLSNALTSAQGQLLEASSTREDRYLMSTTESLQTWTDIFKDMNTQKEGIHGWTTGYEPLDLMLDGIAKPTTSGVCYGIAGSAQHAKSTILLNIALRVARRNEDVSVLFWAIDDSRRAIAYRLISILSGVPMKKVRRMYPPSEEDEEAMLEAQREISRLSEEGRLIFKDDKLGRSKEKVEKWVAGVKEEYNRDILLCIDSLHNIIGGEDTRSKLIGSSTWIKGLCTKVPLSAMATLELVNIRNLSHGKPNITFISETVKLQFDFDALAIAWNELQSKYGDYDLVTAKWGEPGNYKPYIELDWQKNKSAAGEKGPIYFKFEPDTTTLLEATRTIDGLEISKPVISTMNRGEGTVIIESEKDERGELIRTANPGVRIRQ